MSAYVIDESVITKTIDKKWIDTGIQGGLELSHKVEVSDNGNPFIEFAYSLTDGRTVTRTEWEVRPLRPFEELSSKMQYTLKKMVESESGDAKDVHTTEQAAELYVKQKRRAQMQRLIEVASLFTPKEELLGRNFSSYYDFISFISQSIGNKCKGVKLRVKLVYNFRGFVDTPDYVRAGDPWIEREDEVSLEDSRIKINEGKDVLKRPAANGSRPQKKENPLEVTEETPQTPKQGGGDLPF